MRFGAVLLEALLLSPLVQLAGAIYADEAYQLDFHHALLGLPRAEHTLFQRPSANSRASLLYTLSEDDVLGAVNPKDGALIWRQVLAIGDEEETKSQGVIKLGGNGDTIFSAVGGRLQAWNALDGKLAWQVQEQGTFRALEVLAGSDGSYDVFASIEINAGTGYLVKRYAGLSGAPIWSQQVSSGEPFALAAASDTLYSLSLSSAILGGSKIQVQRLELVGGKLKDSPTIPSDHEVSSQKSILFAGNSAGLPLLIWTDKNQKTVKSHLLGTKFVESSTIAQTRGEIIEKVIAHVPGPNCPKAHFLVHYQTGSSHHASVFHIDPKKGRIANAFNIPTLPGQGAFSASVHDSTVFFVRQVERQLSLISSDSSSTLAKWTIESGAETELVHATSEVLPLSGSRYTVRTAFLSQAGDWTLLRNEKPQWTRSEGLTGVVSAAFVDPIDNGLLEDLVFESQQGLLEAYIHRLRRHIKDLQHLPEWLSAFQKKALAKVTGAPTEDEEVLLSDDQFGFDKGILVATQSGRLALLDLGRRGKAVWNVRATSLGAGEKWDVQSIEPEDNSALVRAAGGEFIRVALADGFVLSRQARDLVSGLKTAISHLDVTGKNALIPVLKNGALGQVPAAEFAEGTTIVTSGDDDVLRGWTLEKGRQPTLAWTFMPGPGEQIKESLSRPAHDPVASIGKALGDRNVLYKYLNPNVLLITAINEKSDSTTMYLIDSVSGSVLHSARHTGVDTTQPIVSTFTENWLAYSFYAKSTSQTVDPVRKEKPDFTGYQLVIAELFESPLANDRGVLGDSINATSRRSSAKTSDPSYQAPHVVSQTFLIPSPISYMTTTSTLQGITPRALLCALPRSHALMSIPRFILDPRRPVGRDPTAAETEEGLFRFSANLEFDAKWMLTHKRELASDIREIIVTPSNLESTSLVFTYGDLDLFGTRVSPIGSFDRLGNGFSKWQLLATVAALAVGTSLLAPYARRKTIDGLWEA